MTAARRVSPINKRVLEPIAAGASARVCRIGAGRVVKIFHAAVSEEMIAREFAAAALAGDAGVPVARPLERLEDEAGRAIVYPEIVGPTLMQDMHRRPLGSAGRLGDMAGLQRQIHDCAAPGLRSLRDVLRTDILYGPVEGVLEAAALDLLDRLPEGKRLLHGDFHIRNIIVSAQGPVAIDWSKAARGDPLADLLRTEVLMRFGEGPQDWITNAARDWAAGHYLRSYGPLAGDMAGWRAVVALAWLRARAPTRQRAFMAYLARALAAAGLPPLE